MITSRQANVVFNQRGQQYCGPERCHLTSESPMGVFHPCLPVFRNINQIPYLACCPAWSIATLQRRAGVFDCKPLPLLWAKFPEHYGEHNTVMLDDLARKYEYNKQNGLVIRPFRSQPGLPGTDRGAPSMTWACLMEEFSVELVLTCM